MTRFGDFTIHAQVGASSVADAVIATHDSLGGPYFVKQYRRLPPDLVRTLIGRADRLVGVKAEHLVEHLGHGIVDGIPFTVAPIVEGIDLNQFIASLKERRVSLGLDLLLFIAQKMARAVMELRAIPPAPILTHGDISAPHIRITREGGVILTGVITPRSINGAPSQEVWDGAGVAAAIYDLLPMLRPGTTRPPLPPALERVVRRSLGIVPETEAIKPEFLLEHLEEAALMLKAQPNQEAFVRVASRTIDAVHKRMEKAGDTPLKQGVIPIQQDASEGLPFLEPINLESIAELSPESLEGEAEARIEVVSVPPVALLHSRALSSATSSAASSPAASTSAASSSASLPAPAKSVAAAPAPAKSVAAARRVPTKEAPPVTKKTSKKTAAVAPPPILPADHLQASAGGGVKGGGHAVTASFSVPTETTPAPHMAGISTLPPSEGLAPSESPAPSEGLVPFESTGPIAGATDEVTFPFRGAGGGGDSDPSTNAASKQTLSDTSSASSAPATSNVDGLVLDPMFLEPTATHTHQFHTATTSGPEQSAVRTSENEHVLGDLMPSHEVQALQEIDTSDVMEIPPAQSPVEESPFDEPTKPYPFKDELPEIKKRKQPAVSRGLFADPVDEESASATKSIVRATATDDDTDPANDTSEESLGSSDSDGFTEEKTLPNLSLDTDTEQGKTTPAAPRLDKAVRALLARQVITNTHVATAIAAQKQRGGRLLEILVQQQAASDVKVADVLAEAALRPRISDAGLTSQLPSAEICRKLPQTYAQSRRLLPLSVEDGALVLAVVDPFAAADIEEVRTLLKAKKVSVKVATRESITQAIREAYRRVGRQRQGGAAAIVQGILLCAPDDAHSERMGQRLVTEGFSIELANDSAAASAALENRVAHAIVCDVRLSGDADAALLRFARGTERLEDTPFFVYGPDDDDTESRVLDLGADDYFSVPFNLNVVVKKLRRAISKTAAKTDAQLKKQQEVAASRTTEAAVAPSSSSAAATEKSPEAAARSLLDEAPPVESAPLSVPRMVTMVGAVPGLERLRDLPSAADLSDLSQPFAEAIPPPTDVASDPFAPPPSANPVGEPTGVMGTLRQMSVAEIVQSLELGRKSARVELVPTYGERGSLAFTGGQIVYAECEDLRGEDAFFVLASQQEGFFRIHYGVEPPTRNIEKPSMFLLLEAARKADEEENAEGD